MSELAPGKIALLGSGETTPNGGQVYDLLAQGRQAPLRVAILETPAGFQPNSALVAGKVGDFMLTRLQNYRPEIRLLPARARGSAHSPDDPASTAGLAGADMIFLGPGSPTYAVRQLRDSLAWQRLLARHRSGTPVVAASAATIALGAYALPVYEIYKAGADLHWQPGLDLLGAYGLSLTLLPHWNNGEGGAELDTSRCFMGAERFASLLSLLPAGHMVVGIDEHTGLVLDLGEGSAHVLGRGGVTLLHNGAERRFERRSSFALAELGELRTPAPEELAPPDVWQAMAQDEAPGPGPLAIPPEVQALAEQRRAARARRDWAAADDLRGAIAALGWQVKDTPEGSLLEPVAP